MTSIYTASRAYNWAEIKNTYISDLPLVLKHATPSIFADDTQMVTSSCKISELQNQLAEDIENVIQWMADNKLSLNVLKTDFITRSRIRDLEKTLCITVQNESIYRAPFVKSLWFFIDENLHYGPRAEIFLTARIRQ